MVCLLDCLSRAAGGLDRNPDGDLILKQCFGGKCRWRGSVAQCLQTTGKKSGDGCKDRDFVRYKATNGKQTKNKPGTLKLAETRQRAEMSQSQMMLGAQYWDTIAEKMNSRFVKNPFFEHKRNEVLRLINSWGRNNQDVAILKTDLYEEALEPDHLLFGLAKNNKKVYGIDISPQLARMTSQKALQRGVHLSLCVADVRGLAFRNDRFDLIISTSTLDHFPEIDDALKELYRVLKPK